MQRCPKCKGRYYRKKGRTASGKQKYQCKACGRKFVIKPQKRVSEDKKAQIEKLLLKRISLSGISRVTGVSKRWLSSFISDLYKSLPNDLNVGGSPGQHVILGRIESEIDEMLSFVGKKENKKWIWIARDVETRKVIAFHVGDRSKISAKELWKRVPAVYKKKSVFYTDLYVAYRNIIPKKQHKPICKKARKTNHIERFNCTLRQRVSRLVRQSLSFSKKEENLTGAVKYFICNYNQEITTKLAG